MKYAFILFSLLYLNSTAQKCIIDTTMWEKVELRVMEVYKPSKKFKLLGEAIIKAPATISTIDELTPGQVKEIKKKAAAYNGCIVFIDFKDFSGSETFPMRKKNKLYFYWGYFK
jgi:hypothetical protein